MDFIYPLTPPVPACHLRIVPCDGKSLLCNQLTSVSQDTEAADSRCVLHFSKLALWTAWDVNVIIRGLGVTGAAWSHSALGNWRD